MRLYYELGLNWSNLSVTLPFGLGGSKQFEVVNGSDLLFIYYYNLQPNSWLLCISAAVYFALFCWAESNFKATGLYFSEKRAIGIQEIWEGLTYAKQYLNMRCFVGPTCHKLMDGRFQTF